jgi:tetratricopeptide (TPR) repeat protein
MLLKAGARLHQQGNQNQAERLFRQAIALDPNNADAYFNLGALAEGHGDLVNALGHYRAGLALRGNDPELKEAVASVEGKLRVTAKASDEFRQPERIFTTENAPLLEVHQPDSPLLAVDCPDAPILDAVPPQYPSLNTSGGPFQLNANTNQLNVPLLIRQPDPLLVSQSQMQPLLPVRQKPNKTGRALSVLLTVGANAAMRGAGLHCPRCSFLRFGF